MQVTTEELKYQQAVLQHLNFYKGRIDGIWSERTINAKKKFEFDRSFSPALPNNGLPFGLNDRLPKGLYFKRNGNKMYLHCVTLSDDELSRMLGQVEGTVAVRDPVPTIEPVVEVEQPTEVQAVEAADPVQEPKPAVQQQPQRPNQPNSQHKQHQHQGQRR
jgi:hypothetical protein